MRPESQTSFDGRWFREGENMLLYDTEIRSEEHLAATDSGDLLHRIVASGLSDEFASCSLHRNASIERATIFETSHR